MPHEMLYDTKYTIIAHAVVKELKEHDALFGTWYAEPFRDNNAMLQLGIALQRAVQLEQLKDICQCLHLELPKAGGECR